MFCGTAPWMDQLARTLDRGTRPAMIITVCQCECWCMWNLRYQKCRSVKLPPSHMCSSQDPLGQGEKISQDPNREEVHLPLHRNSKSLWWERLTCHTSLPWLFGNCSISLAKSWNTEVSSGGLHWDMSYRLPPQKHTHRNVMPCCKAIATSPIQLSGHVSSEV